MNQVNFFKAFFFGLFLLLFINGRAQNSDIKVFSGVSQFSTGYSQILNIKQSPFSGLRSEAIEANLYTSFNLGEDYKLGQLDFRIELDVTIEGFNGTSLVFSQPKTLIIDPSTPERLFLYDFLPDVNKLTHFNITINSIARDPEIPLVKSFIDQNITLEVKYDIKYKVDTRASVSGPSIAPVINPLPSTQPKNRVQTFSWDNSSTLNFPNYQFQLLRLYNIEKNYTNSTQIKAEIDWSKALTIETQSSAKSLTISIAEGTGFYVWRIRPIGNYYDGGIANSKNWGAWSNSPGLNNVEIVDPLNLSTIQTSPYYFYYTDPDENINWIYSRSFTEGAKISEQINYANGLQQLLQSQSHLQSKDSSVITQNVLDYSGRTSLTTIPVPVQGGLTGYKSKVIKNENGTLYTADDFDKDSTSLTVPQFHYLKPSKIAAGGVYDFYSDANADFSIPDAKGYPYTRTLYESDGTGRVKEQAGAGRIHSIGSQTLGKGRTVKTYYGSPSDDELLRIFGDEAPEAKSVLKTITVDQNNTTSVTYTSKEGQVIATCMAVSKNDDVLQELDNEESPEFRITNSTTLNEATTSGFISTKRVTFSDTTKIDVGYKVSCDALQFGCLSVEADCGYWVQFFIHDLQTGIVHHSDEIDLDPITCSTTPTGKFKSVNNTTWIPEIPGNVLQPGSYIIKKKIVSKADRKAQLQATLKEVGEGIKPIINGLVGWLNMVTTPTDLADFYAKVQGFSSTLEDAHNNKKANPTSPTDFYLSLRNYYGMKLQNFKFDTSYHVKFDVPYSASGPLPDRPKPKKMIIQGSCCGLIVIPVEYTPPFECYEASVLEQHPEKRPDFAGYMMGRLQSYMSQNNLTFSSLAPGYTETTLNDMVYHMLTDKYFVGTRDADRQAIGDSTYKTQYECNKLWDCWISVVSSYEKLTALNGAGPIKDGIANNDSQDGKSGSTEDEHFDEQQDGIGGLLMKWLVKRALKNRMKEADDNSVAPYTANLVQEFLSCAGYKFAGIVEPNPSGSGVIGVLPTDQPLYDNSLASFYLFPYIRSTVFAFKYFEYGKNFSPNFYPPLNAAFCYSDYSNLNLCENPCGTRTHLQWGSQERLSFYKAVKGYKAFPLELNEVNDTQCPSLSDLNHMFDNLINDCKDACESRRADIKIKVREAFLGHCYNIGGCPTDANVVTEADINKITDEIVGNCNGQCDHIDTLARISPGGYPTCEERNCKILQPDGTTLDIVHQNVPVLMSKCERQHLDMIKSWRFVFSLDSIESKCNPPIGNPTWWNNTSVEECNPDGTPKDIEFSKSYKLEVSNK